MALANDDHTDKKYLCPICGAVVLTVSAVWSGLTFRAISDVVCQNGHRLKITPKDEVVIGWHKRSN